MRSHAGMRCRECDRDHGSPRHPGARLRPDYLTSIGKYESIRRWPQMAADTWRRCHLRADHINAAATTVVSIADLKSRGNIAARTDLTHRLACRRHLDRQRTV